jgi:hypothetical protein
MPAVREMFCFSACSGGLPYVTPEDVRWVELVDYWVNVIAEFEKGYALAGCATCRAWTCGVKGLVSGGRLSDLGLSNPSTLV